MNNNFAINLPDIKNNDNKLFLKNEYDKFEGNGSNISPLIRLLSVPSGTESLAVTLYDPDAPTGSGFWHLIAYDISKNFIEIPENLNQYLFSGNTCEINFASNDFGIKEYSGACPPIGEIHRYIFTVHSLNVAKLNVDNNATNALIRFMINMHTIAKASYITTYARNI